MRVYVFFNILLVSTLLLAFCSAMPVHAALSWSVQTVDENAAGYGNDYCPIVVDLNNTAHIAYTDYVNTTYHVKYASWTGNAWDIQNSDTNTIASTPCYLALDSNGNPLISYHAGGPWPNMIMYATATETTSTSTPTPTQASPIVSALPLLLVLTAVIIMAVVTVVYVWKKKTQKP